MTTLLSAGMSDRFSHAQQSRRVSVEAIECPKCGKRSVVRRSPNVFDCINCSFHKELSPVATSLSSSTSHLSGHSPRHLLSGQPLSSQSLSGQSLSGYQRFSHSHLPLEETAEGEKTHPLVFAALVVIIGIFFL